MSTNLLLDRRSDLTRRLADCLPAASFELEAFTRLIDIAESEDIATAAVTTGMWSRLLVNPDFVDDHCQRDEHLFLLVMHELWHVLLAHTRLHPRVTLAQNIAFDAIINAGLARQFPGAEFRGFFEEINSVDSFPGRLLRPPKGWPHAPEYSGCGPRGTNDIVMRLYPWNDLGIAEPTYAELVRLIEGSREYSKLLADHQVAPVLLGDHEGGDERALDDPIFGDIVRRSVTKWPKPATKAFGAGSNGIETLNEWIVDSADSSSVNRRTMEEVLRRACRPDRGGESRRSVTTERSPVRTPIPDARDRRRVARRRLGIDTVLWDSSVERRVVRREPPTSTKVYLDVSGSMEVFLPELLPSITEFVARRLATSWQFSTQVHPLPLAELRRGKLTTTLGTRIDCALWHALEDPTTRRVVLITDGWIAPISPELTAALDRRGLKVESVIPAGCSDEDLAGFSRVTTLVDPKAARR